MLHYTLCYIKPGPAQVADEFQLLRTAEAMESSKPTTRRRHAGNVPDNKEEKRGKASNEQVSFFRCTYRKPSLLILICINIYMYICIEC